MGCLVSRESTCWAGPFFMIGSMDILWLEMEIRELQK